MNKFLGCVPWQSKTVTKIWLGELIYLLLFLSLSIKHCTLFALGSIKKNGFINCLNIFYIYIYIYIYIKEEEKYSLLKTVLSQI